MKIIIKSTLRSAKKNLGRTLFTMIIILVVGMILFCFFSLPQIISDGYTIINTISDDSAIANYYFALPGEEANRIQEKIKNSVGKNNYSLSLDLGGVALRGVDTIRLGLLSFENDNFYGQSSWDALDNDIIEEWQMFDINQGEKRYYAMENGNKVYYANVTISKAAAIFNGLKVGDVLSFGSPNYFDGQTFTSSVLISRVADNVKFFYNSTPLGLVRIKDIAPLSENGSFRNLSLRNVSANELAEINNSLSKEHSEYTEKYLTLRDCREMKLVNESTSRMNIPIFVMVFAVLLIASIILFNAYSLLVKNRMQEMLVFKACGATKLQTTLLLVAEVILLSLVFGLIGTVAGRFFMEYLVSTIFIAVDFVMASIFPLWIYLASLVCTALISCLAVVLPIYRMSKKSLRESQAGEIKSPPKKRPVLASLLFLSTVAGVVLINILNLNSITIAIFLVLILLLLSLTLFFGIPVVLSLVTKLALKMKSTGTVGLAGRNTNKNYSLVALPISCAICICFVYLVGSFFAVLETSFRYNNDFYSANYLAGGNFYTLSDNKMEYDNVQNFVVDGLNKINADADCAKISNYSFVYPHIFEEAYINGTPIDYRTVMHGVDKRNPNSLGYLATDSIDRDTLEKFFTTPNSIIVNRHIQLKFNLSIGDKFQLVGNTFTIVGWQEFDNDNDSFVYVDYTEIYDLVYILLTPTLYLNIVDTNEDSLLKTIEQLKKLRTIDSSAILFNGVASVFTVDAINSFGDVNDSFMELFFAVEKLLYYIAVILLANSIFNSIFERKREFYVYRVTGMSIKNYLSLSLVEMTMITLTAVFVSFVAMLGIGQLFPAFARLRSDYILPSLITPRLLVVITSATVIILALYFAISLLSVRKIRARQDINSRDLQ